MYKDPIRVDSNDPLLSATSLEGTVIGILFEKSGEEVKEAIKKRTNNIDVEIEKHVSMITPIRDFLKSKEDLIAEIEIYEENRRVEREEVVKPLNQRQKELWRLLDEIRCKIVEEHAKSDKDTENGLKVELEKFKKGWEDIDTQLSELEKMHTASLWEIQQPLSQQSSSSSSPSGPTGISGSQGIKGFSGYSGASGISGYANTSINQQAAKGDIEVDGCVVSHKLRRKINEYKKMFQAIKGKIEQKSNRIPPALAVG